MTTDIQIKSGDGRLLCTATSSGPEGDAVLSGPCMQEVRAGGCAALHRFDVRFKCPIWSSQRANHEPCDENPATIVSWRSTSRAILGACALFEVSFQPEALNLL